MTNAANRKDIRRAEKASRLASAARQEVLAGVMSSTSGRAWVLTLLEATHVFRSTFTGDALSSAFGEGQRNIGLLLLTDIMAHCPNQYVLMMQERNHEDVRRSAVEQHSRGSNGNGGTEAYRIPINDGSDDPDDNDGIWNEAGGDLH